MSTLFADTRERFEHSERLRTTAFALFSGVLGVIFIALLVADEVHAAAL